MRYTPLVFLVLAACSSSTDTSSTRYNFAVVGGMHQSSTAGSAQLPAPITSQLTRDPEGKFASRVYDFFAPAMAYAQQQIPLPGEPVEGAIVCGREAEPGEPQVIPLCAFTLSDGKAANTVKPGTKAGTFDVVFSAQVQSQQPVVDSTTVIVEAGTAAQIGTTTFGPIAVTVDGTIDIHDIILNVRDKYSNFVYAKGSTYRNEGIPNFTPTFVVRAGDTAPYPTWKWADTGEPRPAGESGWIVTLGSEWSGQRVTVYFWVGDAEHHFTVQVG